MQTDKQSFRDTQKPQHRLSMPLFSKCLLSTDLVPGTAQSVEEDRSVIIRCFSRGVCAAPREGRGESRKTLQAF